MADDLNPAGPQPPPLAFTPEVETRRQEFLTRSSWRLAGAGFELYPGGVPGFDLAVVRKKFEVTKFGISHHFFLFATFSSIDTAGLQGFSESCFRYIDQADAHSLPRGLGKAVMCFPVALVPSVDPATGAAVRTKQAKKHRAGLEMPVLVDLGTGELYHLEMTPMWGAAYYSGLRKLAREILG